MIRLVREPHNYHDAAKLVFDGLSALRVSSKPPPMRAWLVGQFWDRDGKPFREKDVPWVTAPNGPCDALDNVQYNEIWLQWAARTFKTTFGQAMMQRQAQFSPCLMMFATRNENLCKQVIGRHWEQLDNNPYFCDDLIPDRYRSATRIDFPNCQVNGTWAGSKSGLADEAVRVGHGNEVDKWEYLSTATEGDPLPRFLKRGGQFPNRKFLIESTPGRHGASRIENGRLIGTNCTYRVPCPHCGKFQQIVFGSGKEPPGIFWERQPGGTHDIELARRTAYYVCAFCHQHIYDVHRFLMSNSGVWVHEGCSVDHDRAMRARELPQFDRSWMLGEPTRDGNVYSSQLSVFHALFHGFGDMAADFLRKRLSEADRRQWFTEEAGATWKPRDRGDELLWEDLHDRIVRPGTRRGVVPAEFSMLTAQFDRQNAEKTDKPIPYLILAWDPARRCHIVDYDYVATMDEAVAIASLAYPCDDQGSPIRVSRAVADHGFEPAKQKEFCRRLRRNGVKVHLVKGSSLPLDTLYKASRLGKDSATPGEILLRIDTMRSQDWVENALHELRLDDPNSLSIYAAELGEHEDICRQLLNDAPDEKDRWDRIDRSHGNDYRDCFRYGKVCMERETRGRAPRARSLEQKRPKTLAEKSSSGGFVRRRVKREGFIRRSNR